MWNQKFSLNKNVDFEVYMSVIKHFQGYYVTCTVRYIAQD